MSQQEPSIIHRDGSFELRLNVSTVLSTVAALLVVWSFKVQSDVKEQVTILVESVKTHAEEIDENKAKIERLESIIFKPMEWNKLDGYKNKPHG